MAGETEAEGQVKRETLEVKSSVKRDFLQMAYEMKKDHNFTKKSAARQQTSF